MKKLISLILLLLMTLVLCSCGKNTEEMFKADMSSIADRLELLSLNCDLAAEGTLTIWENVGAEDFWVNYRAARQLNKDQTKSEYDSAYNEDCYPTVWCAAKGLCPNKIDSNQDMTADDMEYTIDLCVAFNNAFEYIDNNLDTLSDDLRAFRDTYEDQFPDETDVLNDWFIELSLYADFANNPSGNLNSYTEKAAEYKETMDRFSKTIDTYK